MKNVPTFLELPGMETEVNVRLQQTSHVRCGKSKREIISVEIKSSVFQVEYL